MYWYWNFFNKININPKKCKSISENDPGLVDGSNTNKVHYLLICTRMCSSFIVRRFLPSADVHMLWLHATNNCCCRGRSEIPTVTPSTFMWCEDSPITSLLILPFQFEMECCDITASSVGRPCAHDTKMAVMGPVFKINHLPANKGCETGKNLWS